MTLWKDEDVTALKTLWASGLSASKISEAFGGKYNRNSIIGKAHRLGVQKRCERVRVKGQKDSGRPGLRRARTLTPPPEPARKYDGLTLAELGPRQCRWPLGEKNEKAVFFCGHDTENGIYCPDHKKRAYQPRSKK